MLQVFRNLIQKEAVHIWYKYNSQRLTFTHLFTMKNIQENDLSNTGELWYLRHPENYA